LSGDLALIECDLMAGAGARFGHRLWRCTISEGTNQRKQQ
jgi:hypothetical protein